MSRHILSTRVFSTRVILLFSVLILGLSQSANAIVLQSDVIFDDTTGIYTYNYSLENDFASGSGNDITSFMIPFFGDAATALISDSISHPDYWYDFITGAWPYSATDDPSSSTYTQPGVDYTMPDFVLTFSAGAPPADILSLQMQIQTLTAESIACNLSADCDAEQIALQIEQLELILAGIAASPISPGESLSGFSFSSYLGPAMGPILLTTTEGNLYEAASLPSLLSEDVTSVPLPSTLFLLLIGLSGLSIVRRK